MINAETTHFEHRTHQDIESANDEEAKNRHDLEVSLVTALKEKKQKEKSDLEADLVNIDKEFKAKKEY